MPNREPRHDAKEPGDLARLVAENKPRSIVTEMLVFFWSNKKWWMLPILVTLLLLGTLLLFSGTAAAPFIYTLF